MKKNLTILFFIIVFSFLNVPLWVFAQATTPTTINARILPTVWYSALSVNDGDSIKIYAGIQNNSGINFTGVATFYVDGAAISTSPFSSTTDTLQDVSTNWVATPGDHNVQVKISNSLPSTEILVSNQSDESSISITQTVTPITSQDVETIVLNTASNIVSGTNTLANTLANNIDSLKTPIVSDNSSVNVSDGGNNTASTKNFITKEKR
jgi:hypothetical protein